MPADPTLPRPRADAPEPGRALGMLFGILTHLLLRLILPPATRSALEAALRTLQSLLTPAHPPATQAQSVLRCDDCTPQPRRARPSAPRQAHDPARNTARARAPSRRRQPEPPPRRIPRAHLHPPPKRKAAP